MSQDTTIRSGGYHTVLVDPCQMNQKTYQRARVREGRRAAPCIYLREPLRRLEVIASASGLSARWGITWSSRVSVGSFQRSLRETSYTSESLRGS